MQYDLNEEEQTIMFNILSNRIVRSEKEPPITEEYGDDKNALLSRIEILEAENKELKASNETTRFKYEELLQNFHQMEQNYSDLEIKYNDLLISSQLHETKSVDSTQHRLEKASQLDEIVNLSIQLSEVKGKLDAKEQSLLKVKEEKERIYLELSKKILMLKQENDELRENNIKYELLKESYEKTKKSTEEINNIKLRNLQLEKVLKQNEEKLLKLNNFEKDKERLLKKIEEVTKALSEEKERNQDLQKQIDGLMDINTGLENDIKALKLNKRRATIEESKISLINEGIVIEEKPTKHKKALSEIDNELLKKQNSELEVKLKDILSENETLKEEIKTLEERLEYSEKEKSKFAAENTDLKKQNEKMKVVEKEKTKIETDFKALKQDYDTVKRTRASFTVQSETKQIQDLRTKLKDATNEKETLLKETKDLRKQLDNYKSLQDERDKYKSELSSVKTSYDSLKQEVEIKQKEMGDYEKDMQSLKKTMKSLEEENISLSSEIKKFKNYDSSTTSSKNNEVNLNTTTGSEELNLKQMLERSNETIDYYKNELSRRERIFEEQELLLTNMIFNVSRELIFNKFINKDDD